jgi:mono/diheme cytochrome c family protein
MNSALRWLSRAVLLVALVAIACVGWVFGASEYRLRSYDRPPPFAGAVPEGADALARGDHLVRTRGCRGCHGRDLQGQQMWGYAVAPGLAAYAREHGLADFEAAVRHGIASDGRAMYSMPAYSFIRLRDADVAHMFAYLRSLPAPAVDLPEPTLPWRIRVDLARGADHPIAGFLDQVPPLRMNAHADPRLARGEYLAMTTCIECHGFSLRGESPFEDNTAPDLVIVAGYDAVAFERLMHTGIALGGRELPRMTRVARNRFATLTDTEVDDLYAYLSDLAARAIAAR